ncbi:ankyrin repeat and LEM domain-containing protein 2 homolog isoform X1 [Bemisia tabaci]
MLYATERQQILTMDSNEAQNNKDDGFIGLYLNPNDLEADDRSAYKKVYKLAVEILPLLKKYKAARFKYFDDFESAKNFAENGSEGDPTWSSDALLAEKRSALNLRSISREEFQLFKKYLEDCNVSKVQELVTLNPRYLVGSCSFPCILKEGPRYNALHIAAKAKNAEIASIILKTVSDPNTYVRLYGPEANDKSNVKCASLLLDLYLNTPDKTLQETPLHFASKHAATGVVEVLISYPECQKDRPNKYNQTPLDIIASREQNVPASEIEKIRLLLTDPFYVPVLRSEDNSCQPKIGEPFSPTSPVYQNDHEDIISPKLEIKALAGPMAYNQAYMFKKQWKTPPRNFQSPGSPSTPRSGAVLSPSSPGLSPARRIILGDLDRGLEKVGRCLAKEKNIGWKEYWPFLKDFVDLQSKDGLAKLEAYLQNRFEKRKSKGVLTNLIREKVKKSEGIRYRELREKIRKSISKSEKPVSSQNTNEVSPMSELCSEFEKLQVYSPVPEALQEPNMKTEDDIQGLHSSLVNGDSWKSQEKSKLETPNMCSANELPSSSTNMPYLCVEKSCLVFAKRIGDILLSNQSNNNSKKFAAENALKTYLLQEVKHISSLIGNYIDDSAFNGVQFSLLHHRLATRIVSYLLDYPEKLSDVCKDLEGLLDTDSSEPMEICSTPPSRNSRLKIQDETVLQCLIQQCSTILSAFLGKDSGDATLSANCSLLAETEVQDQWELSEHCQCAFIKSSISPPRRHRNRSWNSFKFNQRRVSALISSLGKDPEEKSNCQNEEHSGSSSPPGFEFSESSGESEEEWYEPTAPTDTVDTTCSVKMKNDDIEPMSMPALAPELYIDDSGPCKLDLDVFEAIGDMELDLTKYPVTNYWKFCITSHSLEEREKWKKRRPDM